MAEPMKRVGGLFIGIDVFIWFVGLGTLTAGIVGISNIMIITVKERIGLLELVAFGLRSTGAKMPYFVNPGVDFKLAITALALLVGVGVLAGLMPALRAARITPTEAMKSE
jgi:putative ABC transport system permease protein